MNYDTHCFHLKRHVYPDLKGKTIKNYHFYEVFLFFLHHKICQPCQPINRTYVSSTVVNSLTSSNKSESSPDC